ncbi:plant intracellular Ras-group-related LRR protein 5-like isoform X2 [Telopea speciosissima]|uniref:plant intracellular Ras-group-related LRR protein 5-like isoform X2 n=1 Tax=Telopea speciosissima TaxID=54955 RepID=UPI001CC44580|nr:plant intracellular Ras-group-related LRR protein 5-like isoform X2 [Telopea speciosissima]
MAVTPEQNSSAAFIETVDEIMRIYRSLPPRPTIEEVEAAESVLRTVEREEQMKLEDISGEKRPKDVPEELFSVLQEVKKNKVILQNHEQSREARYLVDLDKMFQTVDDLIQRASGFVSGDTQSQKPFDLGTSVPKRETIAVLGDHRLNGKKGIEGAESDVPRVLMRSSSAKGGVPAGDSGKLNLMKVAGLIETLAKTGAKVLDLGGKLMDQIESPPVSIGKLSEVTELNLSMNHIMALPSSIGGLEALTKLDIQSNQLINLPESFGELVNLTELDLHANRLSSLPASFRNLTNLIVLDLSSNNLTVLPPTLGNLTRLKRLNVETNELEELPYAIGSCSSLVELRLDFNQIKALPEAIGKLEYLEILTLHYSRLTRLPTTIGNLSRLKELDISFNGVANLPENLCLATNLVKLNISNNFADMTALPRSIGDLEMLEELDISNNQIRILPESFRFLSKLRVFHADGTPLEVPPRQILKLGAQEVVQYMADLVAMKDVQSQPQKKKGVWSWFFALV